MTNSIGWILVAVCVFFALSAAWRSWRKPGTESLLNAIITAVVTLFIARGNIEWNNQVPVALWWLVALAASAAVGLAYRRPTHQTEPAVAE